jgi:hypothetical protein
VEDFVQALTAQLDRAQDALALKARTGRPLTFALKDLSIDLRVFWESDHTGRVLLRHAAPNEDAASTVHLAFTTITRSMVEENTMSLSFDEDPRALDSLGGSDTLRAEDRQKLERVGVRTIGQLKRLSAGADPNSMQNYLGIPVMRLQAALERAAQPAVTGHEVVKLGERSLLRIRGANLAADGVPEVRLSGEPVEVVEASPSELLVRPLAHHTEGQVEVFVTGQRAVGFFELPPPAAVAGSVSRGTPRVEALSSLEAS